MTSTAFFVFTALGPVVKESTGCGPANIWSALVVGMNAGDGTHSNHDELLEDLLRSRYVDVDFHFTKRGATFKYVPSADEMKYYDLVIFYTDPRDNYPSGYYAWGYYTKGWDNITEYCEYGGRVMVLLNGDYSAYYLTSPSSSYGKRSTTHDYLGWTSGDFYRDYHYWSKSYGYEPNWPLYGQPDTEFEHYWGRWGLTGSGHFWTSGGSNRYWYGFSPYPYADGAETLLYSNERDYYNNVPVRCGVGYDAGDWVALTWDFAWFNLDEDMMRDWFFDSLQYLRVPGRSVAEWPVFSEIYDEGERGTDQFVELYNPLLSSYPLYLSNYYLSVLDDPKGEGDAYGSYDLTVYDDDGLLEKDEYLVVKDDEVDLDGYKRIGVYWKEEGSGFYYYHEANERAYEIRWGAAGKGLDPVKGLSCQTIWDPYKKRLQDGEWTLAPPSPGERNTARAPDFENFRVVLNEVNADYVELFNSDSHSCPIGGYKVAGFRNAVSIPEGTRLEPGGHYLIPKSELFIGSEGGDIKLLNELGILIDVITWESPGDGAGTSYAARHFDGIGPRGVVLQKMGGDFENRGFDQKNQWWEFNVPATKGTANYNGTTILIDGMDEVFQRYSQADSVYKDGILKERVGDVCCLDSWDIILHNGKVGTTKARLLTDYLNHGGRLYLEASDFINLRNNQEHFYDLLHVRTRPHYEGRIDPGSIAGALFVDGMEFGYDPTTEVGERIDPLHDALRLFYLEDRPRHRFGAAYIKDPTTGYRVVCSSLEHEHMLDTGENTPEAFMDAMVEWFLTPDLNNAPSVSLRGRQAGSTVLVDDEARLSQLGWLGWSNDDPDRWDQGIWNTRDENGHPQYKFMEFTLYLDADRDKVDVLDDTCQIVATTNTTFYRPAGLEPGKYYWTVRAEDRYGKEGGAVDELWGDPVLFSFYYDNKRPEMLSIKPYFQGVRNTGPEMLGFYEAKGYRPTFGPEGQGKPKGILFKAYDEHLGLSFTELEKTELGLKFVSYDPGIPGKTWALGDIGILARDGTGIDPHNGENTVEFIMEVPEEILDDDGTLINGRYTITYRLVDYVGNHLEDDITFTIDAEAPDAVTNLVISELDHSIYMSTGLKYLKAGETYMLSGTGPTTRADGTLDRIEFAMKDHLFNPTIEVLETFSGGDIAGATDTRDYVALFEAVRDYEYFYAVSYDRAGNYAMSGILGGISVDAYAPTRPCDIELGSLSEGFVTVSGWVRDSQVPNKTSGMSHVLLYVNGEVVTHRAGGTYGDGTEYQAGEEMRVQVAANRFTAEVPLTPVSTRDGDIKNLIQVRGVDNVGNMGDMSDASELPPVRMLDPQKSLNVEITETAFGLSEGVDQLKEISVTFLQFAPGDLDHHTIGMSYHPVTPTVDESAIAMLGHWAVDTDVSGDFRARVKIFFQHPSISSFDFTQLKLVTESKGETGWRVLEDAVFVHQEADQSQGIPERWYVEATVTGFSNFAIIQGKSDLEITNTHIFANPLVSGQTVRISATVRNSGEFAAPVDGVVVRVFYVDEDGAESTIGWISFEEPIDPGMENEQTGEVPWETPLVTKVGKMTFYVYFKVDPNAEIAEYNEQNNEAFINEESDESIAPIEVLGVTTGIPSFTMTWFMAALAAVMVVGTAVARCKPRKGEK